MTISGFSGCLVTRSMADHQTTEKTKPWCLVKIYNESISNIFVRGVVLCSYLIKGFASSIPLSPLLFSSSALELKLMRQKDSSKCEEPTVLQRLI